METRNEPKLSRRRVVGGFSTGIVGVMTSKVLGEAAEPQRKSTPQIEKTGSDEAIRAAAFPASAPGMAGARVQNDADPRSW